MTHTISVTLTDDGPATGATVTLSTADASYGIIRVDDATIVVAAGTALTHQGGGVYAYDFEDAEAGVSYEAVVKIAWGDGTTDYIDDPFTVTTENPEGFYTDWALIKHALGTVNAKNASNLDSDGVGPDDTLNADFDRITQTIAEADAYTNRRARMGTTQYIPPIPDTSADFPLIQRATTLYAAYQLIRRRVFIVGDGENGQRTARDDLRSQYLEAYLELFGPARDGIDGATANPDGEPEPGTFGNITIDRGACTCGDEFSSEC